MTSLPGILADVEAVAGTAAALRLARLRGGTLIYISDRPGSDLVKLLGRPAATALVERLGPGEMMTPMAQARGQRGRRAAAAQMLAKGSTVREAALACDIHTRTAWRVKARVGQGISGAADLFPSASDGGDTDD